VGKKKEKEGGKRRKKIIQLTFSNFALFRPSRSAGGEGSRKKKREKKEEGVKRSQKFRGLLNYELTLLSVEPRKVGGARRKGKRKKGGGKK